MTARRTYGYQEDPLPPPVQQRAADPEPEPVYCSRCRRQITASRSATGKTWTVSDIAGYSQRKYGRILCIECQDATKGDRRR